MFPLLVEVSLLACFSQPVVSQLVNQPVSQLVSQSFSKSTSRLVIQSVSRSVSLFVTHTTQNPFIRSNEGLMGERQLETL